MKNYAIIVAGGSGSRMTADVPKQFLLLQERPILMHTIEGFYQYNSEIEIIVALPENQFEYWNQLKTKHNFAIPHQTVAGGEYRFFSVKNCIEKIECEGIVAIHDGVRPLVSKATIERCFVKAREAGNAIPVIDLVDSIREIKNSGNQAVDRSKYKLIQTPQVFKSEILKEAYEQPFSTFFTDDASVVESLGYQINLVEGNMENIKITTPQDLLIADILLKVFIVQ